ncbi:peroxin [Cordyceps militaris CM01]|uniref:Peroxin n=1 Tax=Cordyceps militaris (strain CM01) TaxID=983644 RepID=G3J4I3_CORMM|nr:peroxin [Cordyceps militaris CM01]EGX95853.1 peroxin [Cordyceps militaris CM01]
MDTTGAAPPKAEKQHVETKTVETPVASTSAATSAAVGDVPDPDEDDLDDLDDMLDEFSTVKLDSPSHTLATPAAAPAALAATAAVTAPEAGAKAGGAVNPEDMTEEDFAQQLQAGMANLLGELEKSPEVQAEFESMFKGMAAATEGGAAPGAGTAPASDTPASDTLAGDESFQDTIRRTMERMQNSGEQATAAAASGSSDDFMSELLKQMAGGAGGPGGEDSEEAFSKMLMGMMEQLTNKEILYEPMKELHDKFPAWLATHSDKTPADELKRYQDQHALVDEIVARFEASTYSDSNAADREYIVERMQKMQELGSPPSDLVGDLDTAQEAFAGADEQCNPQ